VVARARGLLNANPMRCLGFVLLAACGASAASHTPDGGGDARAIDASGDAASAGSACASPNVLDVANLLRVTAGSDAPAEGIFDPSLVYPLGATAGAMSYSAVPDQTTIRTHVAISSDGGTTWMLAAEANTPESTTVTSTDATECPGGTCAGNLISEVSSLVYDPTDPDANAQWKLFAHRYLVGSGAVTHYDIGTITLQTAPSPSGPWTAPAKWIGWNSSSPYSSSGIQVNASTLPSTADCRALTEPGAIVLPGSLDLAVGCAFLVGTTPMIRVELLRSTDHAATFTSVGTLLQPADAACLVPGGSINAPDLFVSNGVEYVVATPGDAAGYHGCLVFQVDPSTGMVLRNGSGQAIVRRSITADVFDGACTYADGAGGYLIDVLDPGPQFTIARPGIQVAP
jgi:hypothetical protein